MNELIKIENVNGTESVSAKELYDFLELDKSHYSRWVQKNIVGEQFFVEGVDYQGFAIVANGNETMEYAISIDMAKELSMLARNAKGKEARRYFIEVEKKAKAISISGPDQMRALTDMVAQNNRAILDLVAAVPGMIAETVKALLPAQIASQPKQDYYSIMAYSSVFTKRKITVSEAKVIGMEARRKTLSAGKELRSIPDERWGKVNSYPAEILSEVFETYNQL
jgi:anti-repressor protein